MSDNFLQKNGAQGFAKSYVNRQKNEERQNNLKESMNAFNQHGSNIFTPLEYNPKRSEAKSRSQQIIRMQGNPNTTGHTPVVQNEQGQNTNQDNDISSNVYGNNNYVYNNQDNSIRQYGGDNRSLVINTDGKGSLMDSMDGVGTAGTLAGLWDADDSPGAQMSRLDRQMTANRDAQKKYKNTDYISQGAISQASRNSYIDPQAMDKRIKERENYSRAKSTVMAGNIFGDMFNMKTPEWNSATPAKPVESPDFDKMYNKYTKF